MRSNKTPLFILCIFVLLTVLIFHKYFFSNLVPFPANLLVSFYAPWRYEQWKEYPNGPPNKPIGFDVLKLFYPYRKFTTEQLSKGIIPLWNPYNFAGNVHLATYQSAVLYPLNLIYHFLPLIDAWSLLVVVQPVLAGFFTYLFLKSLNVSLRSAVFGGVVFAFSGWMMAWSEESLVIEHAALWLPLSLFAIEKFAQSDKKRYLFLMTVSLIFSILAGFLQMTIYHFMVVFAYSVYRNRLIKVFGGCIAAIGISAIHLLPSIESFFYSPRGIVDARFLFTTYLMKPWHIITFFAPDFWGNPGTYNFFGDAFYHEKIVFVGIPAFLLALYALFTKEEDRQLRFFKGLTLAVVFLGFFPGGWILYFIKLPIISAMIPSRIFFLLAFSLSVLAAYGVEAIFSKPLRVAWWRLTVCISSFVLLSAWVYVCWNRIIDPLGMIATVSLRNLIIPSGIFIVTVLLIHFGARCKAYRTHLFFLLFGLSIFSANYFALKFLYFSDRAFVFPELPVLQALKNMAGYNRVWGYGNAYIEKNMTAYYGLYSPEGYDALYSQRYGELMFTQEKNGMITDQITRTDATIRQASERDSIVESRYRKRLLSLLGVKYVMESKVGDGKEFSTIEKRFPSLYFSLAWEDDTFRIWEYKQSIPRAFIVHDYIVLTDKQLIANRLFDEQFDLRQQLILEEYPIGFFRESKCGSDSDSVAITNYEPNSVEIAVNASCSGLVFLSDNFYPGWKAYSDGTETKIYRADYSFRAVPIGKGSHTIIFRYNPISFTIGGAITMLSLIVTGVFLAKRKL